MPHKPFGIDLLQCMKCFTFYSINQKPVTLSCGHTICIACFNAIIDGKCPIDQTELLGDVSSYSVNNLLLRLVDDSDVSVSAEQSDNDQDKIDGKSTLTCIDEIVSLSLKNNAQPAAFSRSLHKKIINMTMCQFTLPEGRKQCLKKVRGVVEHCIFDIIHCYQPSQQLSSNLWASVRARGCQFLGPAMQEAVLRLILLALEDGSLFSRKVLVLFVVKKLDSTYPHISKTAVGHVVQLLYRASCFKVTKREDDSSLMQLKDELRFYEALRREHDSQIVTIAMEAGLRISPEHWSSLLYGDLDHRSHMQSIIDKLQGPLSIQQISDELYKLTLRYGDPENVSSLKTEFEKFASNQSNSESGDVDTSWKALLELVLSAKKILTKVFQFIQSNSNRRFDHYLQSKNNYKTILCRDIRHGHCPRGSSCNFAHSYEEMERYRLKMRKSQEKQALSGSCAADSVADDYTTYQSPRPLSYRPIQLPNTGLSVSEQLRTGAIQKPVCVVQRMKPVDMSSISAVTMPSPQQPLMGQNLYQTSLISPLQNPHFHSIPDIPDVNTRMNTMPIVPPPPSRFPIITGFSAENAPYSNNFRCVNAASINNCSTYTAPPHIMPFPYVSPDTCIDVNNESNLPVVDANIDNIDEDSTVTKDPDLNNLKTPLNRQLNKSEDSHDVSEEILNVVESVEEIPAAECFTTTSNEEHLNISNYTHESVTTSSSTSQSSFTVPQTPLFPANPCSLLPKLPYYPYHAALLPYRHMPYPLPAIMPTLPTNKHSTQSSLPYIMPPETSDIPSDPALSPSAVAPTISRPINVRPEMPVPVPVAVGVPTLGLHTPAPLALGQKSMVVPDLPMNQSFCGLHNAAVDVRDISTFNCPRMPLPLPTMPGHIPPILPIPIPYSQLGIRAPQHILPYLAEASTAYQMASFDVPPTYLSSGSIDESSVTENWENDHSLLDEGCLITTDNNIQFYDQYPNLNQDGAFLNVPYETVIPPGNLPYSQIFVPYQHASPVINTRPFFVPQPSIPLRPPFHMMSGAISSASEVLPPEDCEYLTLESNVHVSNAVEQNQADFVADEQPPSERLDSSHSLLSNQVCSSSELTNQVSSDLTNEEHEGHASVDI